MKLLADAIRVAPLFAVLMNVQAWSAVAGSTARAADSAALELPALEFTGIRTRGLPESVGGRTRFTQEELKAVPASAGDPVRAASTLPGITSGNDFSAEPSIRGGKGRETGLFLNGVPLMQPWHFGSVFSIINQQTVGSLDVHTDHLPPGMGNSLSGAFHIQGGGARLDTARIQADMSLLKGNVTVSLPIIANHLGVSFSYHDLWYDQTVRGILDAAAGDSVFDSEMREYRKYVNMPNFQDLQWGLSVKPHEIVRIDYTGLQATDIHNIALPSQANIITRRPFNVKLPEDHPVVSKNFRQAQQVGLDSLSHVELANHVHIVNIVTDLSSRLRWETSFGVQSQQWDVDFSGVENLPHGERPSKEAWYDGISPATFLLERQETRWDVISALDRQFSETHQFRYGLHLARHDIDYAVSLPEPLLKLIESNDVNLLASLGEYGEAGYAVERVNPESHSTDILGEFARRIGYEGSGSQRVDRAAGFWEYTHYAQNNWMLNTKYRMTRNLSTGEWLHEPGLWWEWSPDRQWTTALYSGHYAQDAFPFHYPSLNLRSEKAWQQGWKLQWEPFERVGVAFNPWYRYRYDLAVASLMPTGSLDMSGLLLPHPTWASRHSPEELSKYRELLESKAEPQSLDPDTRSTIEAIYGDYVYTYENAGIAHIGGAELALHYRATTRWSGRLGMELSRGRQRDAGDAEFYPANHHRPWNLRWANLFRLPGQYQLSTEIQYGAGFAYTPYSGTLNDAGGDGGPIVVGGRNSARFAPYSRFDIRIQKTATWGDQNFRTYFEVWNAFNSPNYFLRDSQSGELKFPDLNLPFPFLFFGIDYQW